MNEVPAAAPARPRWKYWLFDTRFGRVLCFVAMFMATMAVVHGALMPLAIGKESPLPARIAYVLAHYLIPPVVAYLALAYRIEKRRPDDLALRKVVPHGVAGFVAGAAFIASVIGVLWLMGIYRVTGTGEDVRWAGGLLLSGLGPAVAEEIVFRGVMFRLVEARWGMVRALAFSALFFGFAHSFNPGATAWSSFAIAVEAGLLLGLVYHVTRSLPACMGIHMAWNFFEGTVFGSAVSGEPARNSWLQAQFTGSDWLTGGMFGVEASVVTVALGLAVSALLYAVAQRRVQNLQPVVA